MNGIWNKWKRRKVLFYKIVVFIIVLSDRVLKYLRDLQIFISKI